MKLRNKKTGRIIECQNIVFAHCKAFSTDYSSYTPNVNSLTELNTKWEDYIQKEPLIKDEKIRKIVRTLFDVWKVEYVKIDSNKYFLVTTIEAIGKGWKLEIPNININGVFKPTELCGEEEE